MFCLFYSKGAAIMKTLYQTKLNKLILFAHAITTFFLTIGLMA